jgi:hypothetical protein
MEIAHRIAIDEMTIFGRPVITGSMKERQRPRSLPFSNDR